LNADGRKIFEKDVVKFIYRLLEDSEN